MTTLTTKSITPYLPFYMGCDCKMMGQDDEDKTFKLTGVSYDDTQNVWWGYFAGTEESYALADDVFPILRNLSDMTEEEAIEMYDHLYPDANPSKEAKIGSIKNQLSLTGMYWEGKVAIHDYINWFPYLLSHGFDLFGLCEQGLAIDKQTLKQ